MFTRNEMTVAAALLAAILAGAAIRAFRKGWIPAAEPPGISESTGPGTDHP